jgi:hypothetical protein
MFKPFPMTKNIEKFIIIIEQTCLIFKNRDQNRQEIHMTNVENEQIQVQISVIPWQSSSRHNSNTNNVKISRRQYSLTFIIVFAIHF